jgi:thioredoxin reductase (NADPH)
MISLRDRSGAETRLAVRHLFVYIGAQPNTDWLAASGLALDPDGFVATEADATETGRSFQTNIPGVFSIGDVRAGSIKRLAAAVGEGAQVIASIHGYLGKSHQHPAMGVAARRL